MSGNEGRAGVGEGVERGVEEEAEDAPLAETGDKFHWWATVLHTHRLVYLLVQSFRLLTGRCSRQLGMAVHVHLCPLFCVDHISGMVDCCKPPQTTNTIPLQFDLFLSVCLLWLQGRGEQAAVPTWLPEGLEEPGVVWATAAVQHQISCVEGELPIDQRPLYSTHVKNF